MKQEKLWTRDFALVTLTGFFASMVVSVLTTTMAMYTISKYGASEGIAGFASSIAMIGSIFGRIIAGSLLDRIGRRRLTMTASFVNAGICALYFLPVGLGPLLSIRLVHGIMTGCVHNAMMTSVIDFIPPARRAEGIAIYSLNYTVALAIGPAICMQIAGRWSYTALLVAIFIFAVISLITLAAIRFKPSVFTEEQMEQMRGRKGTFGPFEKSALPLSFVILPLSICYTSVAAFLETYSDHLGVVWAASLHFTVYGVFVLLTRPIAGRLIDRRGENYVIIPTMLINAVSFVALGLAGQLQGAAVPTMIIVAALFMAVGFGTVLPMGQVIAVLRAEPHRFSRITATYWIFSDCGMGIGAFFLGLIASGIGFSGMFFTEIIIVLGVLVMYWYLHGRHNRSGLNQI